MFVSFSADLFGGPWHWRIASGRRDQTIKVVVRELLNSSAGMTASDETFSGSVGPQTTCRRKVVFPMNCVTAEGDPGHIHRLAIHNAVEAGVDAVIHLPVFSRSAGSTASLSK
jgi:hypothetical protein